MKAAHGRLFSLLNEDFRGAAAGAGDIALGFDTGPALIFERNVLAEGCHVLVEHQVHGTTAKAAAGHTRADQSFYLVRHFDEDVEFSTTGFEVVAHAAMGVGHEAAHG